MNKFKVGDIVQIQTEGVDVIIKIIRIESLLTGGADYYFRKLRDSGRDQFWLKSFYSKGGYANHTKRVPRLKAELLK